VVRRYYRAVSTELKQHLDSAIASEAVLRRYPESIISYGVTGHIVCR
jgi:hypothetical protein